MLIDLPEQWRNFKKELELCLFEQGIDWYEGDENLIGLALIGLSEVHKDDLSEIACNLWMEFAKSENNAEVEED